MKENSTIKSIATLTQEEMANTKGGLAYSLVNPFPYGIPVIEYVSKMTTLDRNVLVNEALINKEIARF